MCYRDGGESLRKLEELGPWNSIACITGFHSIDISPFNVYNIQEVG